MIVIDCGACKGKEFKSLTKDYDEFRYIAFEPNPKFYNVLEAKPIELHKKAVWVEEGAIDFYVAENDESSTLYADKRTGEVRSQPISVACINFSEFLKQFKNEYVVVRMDIEGAEYEVLEKLFNTSSIVYIDKLLCEFHYRKIPSISKERHKKLLNQIQNSDIRFVQI